MGLNEKLHWFIASSAFPMTVYLMLLCLTSWYLTTSRRAVRFLFLPPTSQRSTASQTNSELGHEDNKLYDRYAETEYCNNPNKSDWHWLVVIFASPENSVPNTSILDLRTISWRSFMRIVPQEDTFTYQTRATTNLLHLHLRQRTIIFTMVSIHWIQISTSYWRNYFINYSLGLLILTTNQCSEWAQLQLIETIFLISHKEV